MKVNYEDLTDKKVLAYQKLSRVRKVILFIQLLLANIIRSDTHRCPNCGSITWADQASINMFGYSFKASCHKCGHKFSWHDTIM